MMNKVFAFTKMAHVLKALIKNKRGKQNMEIKLKTDHKDLETELGIIDIWQIENGELLTVEIFPNNQTDESFQAGEFTNVWNILDIDSNILSKYPKEWTAKQRQEIEQKAKELLAEMR